MNGIRWIQGGIALAVGMCSLALAPGESFLEGQWKAKSGPGTVQLEMEIPPSPHHGRSELALSLSRREVDSAMSRTGDGLELRRDAGTFTLTGFHGERGEAGETGRLRFSANPQYAAELERLGYEEPGVESLLELAFHDVRLDYVRAMQELGFKNLTLRQLGDMSIHGVSPEYVRELARLGYSQLTAAQLITLRMHGVSASCIREIQKQGNGRASIEELEMLGMHGMMQCQADGEASPRP